MLDVCTYGAARRRARLCDLGKQQRRGSWGSAKRQRKRPRQLSLARFYHSRSVPTLACDRRERVRRACAGLVSFHLLLFPRLWPKRSLMLSPRSRRGRDHHLSVISFRHRVGMAPSLSAFAFPRARRRCLRPIFHEKKLPCSWKRLPKLPIPLQWQFVRPTNLYSASKNIGSKGYGDAHTHDTEVRRQGRRPLSLGFAPKNLFSRIFLGRFSGCSSVDQFPRG